MTCTRMTLTQTRIASSRRTEFDCITVTSYERRVVSNHPEFDNLVNRLVKLTTTKSSKPFVNHQRHFVKVINRWIFITEGQYSESRFNVMSASWTVMHPLAWTLVNKGVEAVSLIQLPWDYVAEQKPSEHWSTFPHEKILHPVYGMEFFMKQLLYSRSASRVS